MIGSEGLFKATVEAEHRDGICNSCGIPMIKEIVVLNGEEVIRMKCSRCGGGKGQLIARSISIQQPNFPDCPRFSCLWRFPLKLFLYWLVSVYHCKRVVYAEKHRHKNIPMVYRTGEDSPQNIRQAILGIIKLKLLLLRR